MIQDYQQIWENLTLSNDFLFGKIMNDKKLCTEMIKRILPDIDIGKIKLIQSQKSSKSTFDTRGVRFDVYAKSDNKKIFDCEVQTSDKKDLPRRTRAYHIVMGLEALNKNILKKSGSYNDLPDVFVIFICTFDPFNQGRHIYSFYNRCNEDVKLKLNDGAATIFLNTEGKIDDVSPKLKAFLDFMKGEPSEEDSFIQELDKKLFQAKQNSRWREEYMLLLMREQENRAEAMAEGRAEGLAEGRAEGRVQGMAEGRVEGRAEGRLMGIREANFETARRLREMGMNDNDIHRATNLSLEDLRTII